MLPERNTHTEGKRKKKDDWLEPEHRGQGEPVVFLMFIIILLNESPFGGLKMLEISRKFAHTLVVYENYVFYGFRAWAYKTDSITPSASSLTYRDESCVNDEPASDIQKSLLDSWSNPHRKSTIFNGICSFSSILAISRIRTL